MNYFWQGFSNGFAFGMLNNMWNCFVPRCSCWNTGFNIGMSVFNLPVMNYGTYWQPFNYHSNYYAQTYPSGINYYQPNNGIFSNYYQNYDFSQYRNGGYSWNTNTTPSTNNSSYSPDAAKNDKKINVTYNAEELYSKWSKKKISKDAELTEEFCQKVVDIAQRTKCNADDLMAVMFHESRLSPKVTNKYGYVGLIQFGAEARKSFGIPGKDDNERKQNLQKMSAINQLDYVEKYINYWRKTKGFDENHLLTLGELYSLVLYPKNAKKDIVIDGTDNDEKGAYNSNKGMDINKDKKISKSELETFIRNAK